MVWVYVVIGLVGLLAVVEWTSRPRRREQDTTDAVPPVRVPQPRTPAPGWTTSSAQRSDRAGRRSS